MESWDTQTFPSGIDFRSGGTFSVRHIPHLKPLPVHRADWRNGDGTASNGFKRYDDSFCS